MKRKQLSNAPEPHAKRPKVSHAEKAVIENGNVEQGVVELHDHIENGTIHSNDLDAMQDDEELESHNVAPEHQSHSTNLHQFKALLSHFIENPLQIASQPHDSREILSLMESLKTALLIDQNQHDVAVFPTETFSRLICKEIFIHILSFLDPYEIITSVRFVSKEFFELSEKTRCLNSQQAFCVQDMSITDFEYIIDRLGSATQILYLEADLLVYLANATDLRPLENVSQLIFPAWASCWTKQFFEKLPILFPNLTCLFMNAEITYGQFEKLEPLDLKTLCDKIPSLVQVEICKTCNLTPEQLGRLEKLTVYNYEDGPEDFEKILKYGANLVEIYVTNFPRDFALSPSLTANCPRLTKLHVDEEQISPILNALDPKQLTHLVIFSDSDWSPSSACIKALCNLERLARLEVSSWEPIQDVCHKFKFRESLKALDIIFINNKRSLNYSSLTNFPNLRSLQLPHFQKNFSIEKFHQLEHFQVRGKYAEMFISSASLQKLQIENVKKLIVDCPRLSDISQGTYDSIVVLHARLPVITASNVDVRSNVGLRVLKLKAYRPIYKLQGGEFSNIMSLEMGFSLLKTFAQNLPDQANKICILTITPSNAMTADRKPKDLNTIMRLFPNISRLGLLHSGFQRVTGSATDPKPIKTPSYPKVLKVFFSEMRCPFSVEYPLMCFPNLMYVTGSFTTRSVERSLDDLVAAWKNYDIKFPSVRQATFECTFAPFTPIAQFFPKAHTVEYTTCISASIPTTRPVIPVHEHLTSLSIDGSEYHILDKFPKLASLRVNLNHFHGDVSSPISFANLKRFQLTYQFYGALLIPFTDLKKLVNCTTMPSLRLMRLLFNDEIDFQARVEEVEQYVEDMKQEMPNVSILLCPGNLADEFAFG